jgi:hypothetical protein
MSAQSAAPGGGNSGPAETSDGDSGIVARLRGVGQPSGPVDRQLEGAIDGAIESLNSAAGHAARVSAWRRFLELRAQRSAAHVEALERDLLARVLKS